MMPAEEPDASKLAERYADERAPLFEMDGIAYGLLGALVAVFNLFVFSLLSWTDLFEKSGFACFGTVAIGFAAPYFFVQHRKYTNERLFREEYERQKALEPDNGY